MTGMVKRSDNTKVHQATKFGQLCQKLAEQYWSPASTTVVVERLFSTAGDIVTNERNQLKSENAEKLLFLHENLPKVNFRYTLEDINEYSQKYE